MNPSVLVVEDDVSLRQALCDTLELAGFQVAKACDGYDALDVIKSTPLSLVISDVQMGGMDGITLLHEVKSKTPELPMLMMTAFGTIEQAVSAMREGAVDYLVKPFEADVLVSKVSRLLEPRVVADQEMVAVDAASRALLPLAERVAASEVTVLITGESGTGKEVLAQFIHRHSPRYRGPFIAINCAAIPENMLEAVLFGYEKGAFTGAHKGNPGKFEQAEGGTLLLDEISEMALGLQAKLLRVLQEREVERLGGRGTIELDLRVLATSNCDIAAAVSRGEFREDLYYRLNVLPLHLPPLRDRPGDVLPIAKVLLERAAQAQHRQPPMLGRSAIERLMTHHWPGNVRELDNTIQRALVLQIGDVIEAGDLRVETTLGSMVKDPGGDDFASPADALGDELRTQEHRLILDALSAESGNRRVAADKLGISPRTLRYKLAKMRDAGLRVPGSQVVWVKEEKHESR